MMVAAARSAVLQPEGVRPETVLTRKEALPHTIIDLAKGLVE